VDALGPNTRGGVMTAMCCKLRSQVGCSAHAADSCQGRREEEEGEGKDKKMKRKEKRKKKGGRR
jgi:hypothetical protein